MALVRMQQRRGTQAEWNDPVIASTVILQAGELGLETDTGRFKIGNGTTIWQNLPYYLPDNNPTSAAGRVGKNLHDVYSKLSPLGPSYSQTFTGTQLLVSQSSSQIPLVVSGVNSQSAVLQRWRDSLDNTLATMDQTGKLTAAGGASFNAVVNMNSNKITNLGSPTSDNDAVTKIYVDDAIAGLAWKAAVNLIAYGAGSNVALTGSTNTLIVDGHSALDSTDTGYRILLAGQTTASENGIYVYTDNGTTYTLARASDANTYQELIGASVYVQEGTTYGTSSWVQSNHYLTSFSGQTWVQFSGASLITAGDGMTKDGNRLDVVGTTNRITANADSIDIASTYVGQTSITTLGTVATGTWDATTIAADKGGTGQSSYAIGDMLFADSSSTLAKLTAGTSGYPLISQGTGSNLHYAQLDTTGLADDAVTYAKLQNVANQYRVLGRISSGSGNAEEINPDQLMTILNQGTTDIVIENIPTGTTSTTVALGNHTHAIDDLSDVVITGTPVTRQVIKFNGTQWVNELPSGGISIAATAPTGASNGDAWFDSTDGSLYVYYDDGSGTPSAQWVQVKANSALEGSILTRLSAVEARDTKLEAANAVRVANATERDSVYPSPVQGNTVFRADLGYEQKYYAAYNATTNPDGTTGTVGWYEYRGGAPLSQNYVINGDMEINQRNVTSTSEDVQIISNYTGYSIDRWKSYLSTTSAQRVSRQSATITDVPIRYSLRLGSNSTAYAYGGLFSFGQKIESINAIPLRGKTITFSFYVKFSSATFTASLGNYGNFRYEIGYNTSTTDSTFVMDTADSYTFSTITNGSLPTSWTRVTLTGTVPTNANNIHLGGRFLSTAGYGYTSTHDALYCEIAAVQLEEGPVATPFRRNQPNLQAELAACQRYYIRFTGHGTGSAGYPLLGAGVCITANQVDLYITLPSQLRTTSYTVETSNAGVYDMSAVQSGGTWSIPYTPPTPTNYVIIRYTHTASSFTVARYSVATSATSGASYIALNAEL